MNILLDSKFYILDSRRRNGQSLVEILVAIAIGALMVIASATLIAPALRTSSQAANVQVGVGLAKELLDNVRVWSEGNWRNISNLATSSAGVYYLNTSSSPFTVTTGTQSIAISTTTYTRYFYVSDVYRDGSGNITTQGGSFDPSTKQVTVAYSWLNAATSTISAYLTRNRDTIYDQTDWSGGPNQSGPVTSTNNAFATSSNIDYTTSSGSIYINLPGY